MKNRNAFSLIEALLAIAVLALLLLLAFPVVSMARKSSLNARSVSNLRQIGVALTTFVTENGGAIMPRAYASSAETPKGQYRFWTATLFNNGYLPDERAFYDPRFAPFGPEKAPSTQRVASGTPATYGMRDWTPPGGKLLSTTIRVAKKVTLVREPALFFIVADSYWTAWGTQGYGISPGLKSGNNVRLDERGEAGTLFLDGHVRVMPKAYFESLAQTQGEYSDGEPIPTWSEK